VEVEKVLIATPTVPPAMGDPRFGGTLRIVSQASIPTLDSVWSFATTAIAVSQHLYETLYGWDSEIVPRPRMADSFTLSSDGKTYTFNLREGLTWHDGTPVTSEDVTTSLERWLQGASAAAGMIREFAEEDTYNILNDSTFEFRLKSPFGAVIDAFSPAEFAPLMMPKRLSLTPPTEGVEEFIGSGPYKFTSWSPGDRVVLDRFEAYVPRGEPADHMVGASVAYLDQLIWLEIPDEETKIAGLETGEWDLVDGAGLDFYDRLSQHGDLTIPVYKPGHRSNAPLNGFVPPFGNPESEAPAGERFTDSALKARLAAQAGIDVEEIQSSLGPDNLWITCPAINYCGTPLETDFGSELYNENDKVKAKRLLDESGYAGETVVLLNPTDYATITPVGIVLKSELEKIGFDIEMPALDWATIVPKFSTDEWQVFASWSVHSCCGNPLSDEMTAGEGHAYPKVPKIAELRLKWATETDPAERFRIVEQIQKLAYENVVALYLGVFFSIYPHTADLKNLEIKALPFYANTWLER
jgi:peptide/nickel transport system substrate-binding protein